MSEQTWRDMPAGLDLDRVIADRLGWSHLDIATEKASFRAVGLYGYPPTSGFQKAPNYSTDANAALTLPLPKPISMEVSVYTYLGDNNVSCFVIGNLDVEEERGFYRGAFAYAYCRAWLDFMDRPNEFQQRVIKEQEARP